MKKQTIVLFILITILSIIFFGCDAMAVLFHGEEPPEPKLEKNPHIIMSLFHGDKSEPEKKPQISIMQDTTTINNSGNFSFPQTKIAFLESVTFSILNSGEANLIINSNEGSRINLLDNETGYFTISQQPLSDTIAPGNTITFAINFSPTEAGVNFSAVVQITTNCQNNPNFSFRVIGSGYRTHRTEPVHFYSSSLLDTNSIFDIASILNGSATVEIYAGGAGGGGAGGHHREGGGFGATSDYYSAGGAGGGGAVEYRRIDITQQTIFNVSIGIGGNEGIFGSKPYFNTGQYTGGNGSAGGATTISWESTTIIAEGGKGGIGGGPDTIGTGGAGGRFTVNGANGSNGSTGTRAGSGINTNFQGRSAYGTGGSYNNFSAGNGGYGGGATKTSENGQRGESGKAMIVFTWYE